MLSVGVQKLILIRADLLYVDLVEARLLVSLECGDVTVQIGPAGDLLGYHLLGDELNCLLEVRWGRQDLCEFSG